MGCSKNDAVRCNPAFPGPVQQLQPEPLRPRQRAEDEEGTHFLIAVAEKPAAWSHKLIRDRGWLAPANAFFSARKTLRYLVDYIQYLAMREKLPAV